MMNRSLVTDRDWIILWIIGSMMGWVVGIVITFAIRVWSGWRIVDPFYGDFYIFGICIGIFQWLVALRGKINGVAWTFATLLSSVLIVAYLNIANNEQLIPPITQYRNLGCLSDSCDSFMLRDTWFSGVLIYGLIGGLAVATPTSVILCWSGYGSKIYRWWIGCILASVLGLLVYLPFMLGDAFVGIFCYVGIVGPLVMAVLSAPFLDFTLHRPVIMTTEAR